MAKYTMPFTEPASFIIDRLINKYGIHMQLQAIRTSKHMTQEEASVLSGLSVGTISRVETGGNVTLGNIIRYAHSLGYEITIKKMDKPLSEIENEDR